MKPKIPCSCGKGIPRDKEHYNARYPSMERTILKHYGFLVYIFLFDCDCRSTMTLSTGRDVDRYREMLEEKTQLETNTKVNLTLNG